MCLDKFDVSPCLAQVSVNKEKYRRDNRPLREAMEEQYIGWIIGLEGDECISADTDFACSLGMAFAVA